MVWPGFEHLHVDRVCIAVTTGLMKALGFIVALLGITPRDPWDGQDDMDRPRFRAPIEDNPLL